MLCILPFLHISLISLTSRLQIQQIWLDHEPPSLAMYRVLTFNKSRYKSLKCQYKKYTKSVQHFRLVIFGSTKKLENHNGVDSKLLF